MKCITLTLNPAFDRHCLVPDLTLGREHLATSVSCNAGGKGINISRSLKANGIASKAVVVVGNENGDAFCKALKSDGIDYFSFLLGGRVRENFTIHSENSETRISFEGFCATDDLLDQIFQLIKGDLSKDTILTFTGRAPKGVGMEAINKFLKKVTDSGTKVVIDSRSFTTLKELITARPWLIKPNGEEISAYLGREITTHDEILEVAREIHQKGIENVMVSLGAKGALLVCPEGAFVCTPPKISAKSTVGAGDSSIGGFIAATLAGLSAADALKTSVAYGTAACLSDGTLPPAPEDIKKIISQVVLTKL